MLHGALLSSRERQPLLSFATLIYVILCAPGVGLTGWEWFWVILAALFDLAHLAATIGRRHELMQSVQRA